MSRNERHYSILYFSIMVTARGAADQYPWLALYGVAALASVLATLGLSSLASLTAVIAAGGAAAMLSMRILHPPSCDMGTNIVEFAGHKVRTRSLSVRNQEEEHESAVSEQRIQKDCQEPYFLVRHSLGEAFSSSCWLWCVSAVQRRRKSHSTMGTHTKFIFHSLVLQTPRAGATTSASLSSSPKLPG